MIKLTNSLTGKKEEFKPIKKNEARMYSCGPTVYSAQHIGNMRSMLLADIVIRTLKYNGIKVKHVINYTDVGHLTSDADEGEDKVEKAAKKEGLDTKTITKKYIDMFETDLEKLNIELGKRVKATNHIEEQIQLIKDLDKKGFTYKTSDGVYFDTSKFKDYGKLAGFGKIKREAGKRVSLKEKKNPTDFALWKFSGDEKRLQEWESPWGVGFPGWHIECSAMSMKYLGKSFDIHTGGQDLSQAHHNNEIAQSESATGKEFVKYWLHGGYLLFKGKKVSKSKGGLYTVTELEKEGFNPLAFRYLCLQTHYRKPLNFTIENLEGSQKAINKIKDKIIEIKSQKHKGKDKTDKYGSQFLKAINDDLNISQALSIFNKSLSDFDFDPKKKIKLLEKFDNILGLNIKNMKEEKIDVPEEIKKLLKEREKLRKDKLWAESDIVRERIKDRGFIVKDTQKGQELKKI